MWSSLWNSAMSSSAPRKSNKRPRQASIPNGRASGRTISSLQPQQKKRRATELVPASNSQRPPFKFPPGTPRLSLTQQSLPQRHQSQATTTPRPSVSQLSTQHAASQQPSSQLPWVQTEEESHPSQHYGDNLQTPSHNPVRDIATPVMVKPQWRASYLQSTTKISKLLSESFPRSNKEITQSIPSIISNGNLEAGFEALISDHPLPAFVIEECLRISCTSEEVLVVDHTIMQLTDGKLLPASWTTYASVIIEKLNPKMIVMLPLCYRRSWCLAVFDLRTGDIYYYDSLETSQSQFYHEPRYKVLHAGMYSFADWLSANDLKDDPMPWSLRKMEVLSQVNIDECGCHVFLNAIMHVFGRKSEPHPTSPVPYTIVRYIMTALLIGHVHFLTLPQPRSSLSEKDLKWAGRVFDWIRWLMTVLERSQGQNGSQMQQQNVDSTTTVPTPMGRYKSKEWLYISCDVSLSSNKKPRRPSASTTPHPHVAMALGGLRHLLRCWGLPLINDALAKPPGGSKGEDVMAAIVEPLWTVGQLERAWRKRNKNLLDERVMKTWRGSPMVG